MKTFLKFISLLKSLHGIHQQLKSQKERLEFYVINVRIFPATAARGLVYAVSYSPTYNTTDVMDNNNLATAILAQIQISIALIGKIRKPSIEPIVLAERWGITPEKAQKTIQATMQRGIRTMLHPLLWQHFRAIDNNLWYHHLAYPVVSDTKIASTVSKRGNRCAQVYPTDFGWARAFPMASRNEAHVTLSLLFAGHGVPPACIHEN